MLISNKQENVGKTPASYTVDEQLQAVTSPTDDLSTSSLSVK